MKFYKHWLLESNWEQKFPKAHSTILHLLLQVTEGMTKEQKIALLEQFKKEVLESPGSYEDNNEILPKSY